MILGVLLIFIGVFLYMEGYYRLALLKHVERHKVKADWIGNSLMLKVRDSVTILSDLLEKGPSLSEEEIDVIVKKLEVINIEVDQLAKKGRRHIKYCSVFLKFINSGILFGHLNFLGFFRLKRLVKKHCYENDFYGD